MDVPYVSLRFQLFSVWQAFLSSGGRLAAFSGDEKVEDISGYDWLPSFARSKQASGEKVGWRTTSDAFGR